MILDLLRRFNEWVQQLLSSLEFNVGASAEGKKDNDSRGKGDGMSSLEFNVGASAEGEKDNDSSGNGDGNDDSNGGGGGNGGGD